jgi:intracellular multiplication protein IcmK
MVKSVTSFVCGVSVLGSLLLTGSSVLYSPAALAQESLSPPVAGLPAPAQDFGDVLRDIAVSDFGEDDSPQNPGMQLPDDGHLLEQAPVMDIEEEAFDASLTGALPMTPEQIRIFLESYDETQNVIQTPVYEAPDPKVTIENVSLDPGATPLKIDTAVGFVTTLNFIDVTGEKWPIKDIGWAGNYEVLQPEDSSHIIRVTPMSEFGHGNISVRLVGLKTPIILSLSTSRDSVHYRADLRVPKLGPDALPPVMAMPISTVAGSDDMTAILTGVIPVGSEKMVVSGVDSRTSAYMLGGQTFVRTPYTLLSPGWSSSMKSSDGTTVYEIGEAPVLLLSHNGKITRAYLKKKEAVDGL